MTENKLHKQFAKDFNFFLPTSKDIEVFNRTIDIRNRTDDWVEYKQYAHRHPDFVQYGYDVKNSVIKSIRDTPEYLTLDSKKYTIDRKFHGSKDYIKDDNIGTNLVSLDLVTANFQALKYANSKVVLDAPTYADLISKFTDEKSIQNSKQIRQIIFGNLNPKFQQTVERYIINQILKLLVDNNLLDESQLVSITSDEIVYQSKGNDDNIMQKINETPFNVRCEKFTLEKFNRWFVKRYDDKRTKLLQVSGKMYAQIYRKFYDLDIIDKDLWFEDDGYLCKFIYPFDS
jgi:hypothetical protein